MYGLKIDRMKLLLKILLFIFTMIITVGELKSSTATTFYDFSFSIISDGSHDIVRTPKSRAMMDNPLAQLAFAPTAMGGGRSIVNLGQLGWKGITKLFTRTAAKGGAQGLRSFTSSNFRYNLGKMTGNIPANSQAHHVFPKKYASQFSKAGININDPKYGTWWNSSSHLQNAAGYNAAWGEFFTKYPNATQLQILNQGRSMMQQYGIAVFF
jgi:hypothetical protein